MGTLYERLNALCQERGIKGGRMCVDLGISKSLMTDLKMGRKKTIQIETAQKIAEYFGVPVGQLLGSEEKEKPIVNDDELSDTHMELIELARTLSEEDAALLLIALKARNK